MNLEPLNPSAGLTLDRDEHGQLRATLDGTTTPVGVRPCFPWSQPGGHFSIRDEEGNEIALVRDLADLDPASRDALEAALHEASFMLHIVRIETIEKEYEMRTWHVHTKQGERTFQTRLDSWPRPLATGGSVIQDISGDIYFIPRAAELDDPSRKLLWPLMDTQV